jgi:phospholipid-transporting ATPase
MEAGCKIWVLTGDRQETAINIGFSCKLITSDMLLLVCNNDTHFDTKEYLTLKLASVKDTLGISQLKATPWERFWFGISSNEGKFDKDAGFDLDVRSFFSFFFILYHVANGVSD